MPSQTSSPELDWANGQFQNTFDEGIYCTLPMIDLMLRLMNKSYRDYLRNPFCFLQRKEYEQYLQARFEDPGMSRDPAEYEFTKSRKWLSAQPDDRFGPIIGTGTGRCTSFAIETAKELTNAHPENFDFKFYRLGNHHLARCDNTGIVMDSSSETRAFVLGPGEEFVLHYDQGGEDRWGFDGPSTSRFIKRLKDGATMASS